MSAGSRTNEELLDTARHGDEGALAVLVERHHDRLERMVRLLKDVFQGMPPGIAGV
jgi:hypothetical protein